MPELLTPPWIEVAQELLGIKETPGSFNNPKIIAWAKVIGGDIEKSYVADSIPWCGLFVAYCMVTAGIPPVKGALWALNWSNFGVKLNVPHFGSIGTISRDGGGHVFFVVSQDRDSWHALGGNQSDMVNITRISKGKDVRFNYPIGYEKFHRPVPFKPFDGKLSISQKFS